MKAGFLVVDKPAGITSHDVVGMVRSVTGTKRVGHTGTLDPFATGVLPLALGKATKLIRFLDESEKVYDATLHLGSATDTGDLTGEVIAEVPVPACSDVAIRAVLASFVGGRMQVPPRYSAVKVKGRPLYSYARAGEDVTATARPIVVHGMELIERSEQTLRVLVRCGRGTYVRVLAEEIGEALGSRAHLVALRRLRSGPFSLEEALDLDELADIAAGQADWRAVFRAPRGTERPPRRSREVVAEGLSARVHAARSFLGHHPSVSLAASARTRFGYGGPPPPPPPGVGIGQHYLVLDGEELVAVGELLEGGKLQTAWRAPTGS